MHTFGNFIQKELFANVVDYNKHYHQRWRQKLETWLINSVLFVSNIMFISESKKRHPWDWNCGYLGNLLPEHVSLPSVLVGFVLLDH